jgi:hypothetical protein
MNRHDSPRLSTQGESYRAPFHPSVAPRRLVKDSPRFHSSYAVLHSSLSTPSVHGHRYVWPTSAIPHFREYPMFRVTTESLPELPPTRSSSKIRPIRLPGSAVGSHFCRWWAGHAPSMFQLLLSPASTPPCANGRGGIIAPTWVPQSRSAHFAVARPGAVAGLLAAASFGVEFR